MADEEKENVEKPQLPERVDPIDRLMLENLQLKVRLAEKDLNDIRQNVALFEQKLSEKYQIKAGDGVAPDGAIVRNG